MVAQTCHPNTWEVEMVGSGVILSYIVSLKPVWVTCNHSLKKKKDFLALLLLSGLKMGVIYITSGFDFPFCKMAITVLLE